MARIDYVACLDQMYQSQGFPPYRWSQFDTSPWCQLGKPLKQACLALLSSAGISRDDQEPFDPWAVNDLSFRQIPVETPQERLVLRHNYFDHRDALRDMNCVLPFERLRALVEEGYIGSLAPQAVTLGMGRLYKRTALQREVVPRIVEVLKRQGADAAFLVPA
jgi:D-proline reductase (dithiol) PrdB